MARGRPCGSLGLEVGATTSTRSAASRKEVGTSGRELGLAGGRDAAEAVAGYTVARPCPALPPLSLSGFHGLHSSAQSSYEFDVF